MNSGLRDSDSLPGALQILVARFEREARTVSSLNHPHICTLHDVGSDGDTDSLVMELIEDLPACASPGRRRGREPRDRDSGLLPLDL